MVLPIARATLKGVSSKNTSLQDILKSCSRGVEILSVEKHVGGIHNTKITLKVDLGAEYTAEQRYVTRVHFYNRLPLTQVLASITNYPTSSVNAAITMLNVQHGCDFTAEDVELVGGILVAKDSSLGYFNATPEDGACNCVMDHQGLDIYSAGPLLADNVDMGFGRGLIEGITSWDIDLLVNGTVYRKNFLSNTGITLNEVISTIMNENSLYEQMSFSLTSAGTPSFYVQNLTNQCGSFGVKFTPKIGNVSQMTAAVIGDMELCPFGQRVLSCAGATDRMEVSNMEQSAFMGKYTLKANSISVTLPLSQIPLQGADLVTVFAYLMMEGGMGGYWSGYQSSNEGAPVFISNQTGDCLDMGFYYEWEDGTNTQTIFEMVLGPTILDSNIPPAQITAPNLNFPE